MKKWISILSLLLALTVLLCSCAVEIASRMPVSKFRGNKIGENKVYLRFTCVLEGIVVFKRAALDRPADPFGKNSLLRFNRQRIIEGLSVIEARRKMILVHLHPKDLASVFFAKMRVDRRAELRSEALRGAFGNYFIMEKINFHQFFSSAVSAFGFDKYILS